MKLQKDVAGFVQQLQGQPDENKDGVQKHFEAPWNYQTDVTGFVQELQDEREWWKSTECHKL